MVLVQGLFAEEGAAVIDQECMREGGPGQYAPYLRSAVIRRCSELRARGPRERKRHWSGVEVCGVEIKETSRPSYQKHLQTRSHPYLLL